MFVPDLSEDVIPSPMSMFEASHFINSGAAFGTPHKLGMQQSFTDKELLMEAMGAEYLAEDVPLDPLG